jgi:hypothetical protein
VIYILIQEGKQVVKKQLVPYGFASRPFGIIKKVALRRGYRGNTTISYDSTIPTSSEPATTLTTGGRMKIKFSRSENTKTNPNASGKTYPITRVFGEALEGKSIGQEWSTQFFTSNKEMSGQVAELSPGDIVNVTMRKNGKFWNPESFEKDTTAPASGSGVPDVRVATNPRLNNINTAVKILGPKSEEREAFDYLSEAAGIADLIQDYVDESGAFQFGSGNTNAIPDVDDDKDTD